MWKVSENLKNQYINTVSSKTFKDMEDRINYLEKVVKDKESNKEELVLKLSAPIDDIIRCSICTNQIKSDTGCDGNCTFDKALLTKIVSALTN